jgi:hypothetical protein
MLKNIFTRTESRSKVSEAVQTQPKSVKDVIEEIHESFYTEVDKLLAEAKVSKSLDTDKQDLIDKCNRLKALGFTNTKEVKEAESEIERLNRLKAENQAKNNLTEAINYFSFKYPHYKFITEDSVKKICQKWNLIYGTIDNYIGNVPDKNLKHIEDFKIDETDDCYSYSFRSMFGSVSTNANISASKAELMKKEIDRLPIHTHRASIEKSPLEIAAPAKDLI